MRVSVVYVGIGSNLGNRALQCKMAIGFIKTLPSTKLLKSSIFFETDPVDFLDQPDFVNGVIKIKTKLKPLELLSRLLEIENKMGRKRLKKWGPRSIDLDILDYDRLQFETEKLILPHPRAFQRDFVIKSLLELGFYSSRASSLASSWSSPLVINGQMSMDHPNL
ncbi:MAG: 2-amino-4-hydroxy-6-hydroxymethyldihydropteridine diphosphokinase [Deltaproteobacteria bacterium]|nr:2-amino-4-hydroxy-6-hydroxymethyldihydropteridine diphosphokinase [Deltaproteobacteria bacterium]